MVKIAVLDKPEELTDEYVEIKTKEFIESGKEVWQERFIKNRLMEMSNNKCCYCECKIDIESNWMTVDHFHPKSKYPKEVLLWENLLPACPRCNNTQKRNHDTINEPIINPTRDDPREHFYFYNYEYQQKPGSMIGGLSCDVLGLNNTKIYNERVIMAHNAISVFKTLFYKAEELCEQAVKTASAIARLRNGIICLLEEAQPSSPYSAAVANALLEHPDYLELKRHLENLNLWTGAIEDLHNEAARHLIKSKRDE